MGRITVSLPDDVQGLLDDYAKAHNKPISHVVAEAVRAFVQTGPPSVPAPPPNPTAPAPVPAEQTVYCEDVDVRRYLENLYLEMSLYCKTITDLYYRVNQFGAHEPPMELPEPPWLDPRRRPD